MNSKSRHAWRHVAALLGVVVLTLAWSPGVRAQGAGATLEGSAPPGSEVTVRNTATGLVRRTKVGDDGNYAVAGLPSGTYSVSAGPGTEQVVTLSVASTLSLDLTKLETVTVSGQRLAEVKTSEIGTIVPLQQIQTVPQLTRNFLEFADTVPGMAFTVDSGGNTTLQGGAQNDSSVNVYIDGVGQKDYVKEGGVSGQFFTQGNPFPQLAIGEYKVITSNYKAQYDQISSAAVTAETKSGTNSFEGEVFGTYTGENFRAETPSELAANTKTPSKDKEFGVSIGGPIIQNVLHFFVTYEGKRFNTPIAITTAGNTPADVLAQLPADVKAQVGPGNRPFDEDLYFGKLDWEPTATDRFVLEGTVRRENQSGITPGNIALSANFEVVNNDTRITARWQRSADRWFNELLVTYEDAFNSPTADSFGNGAIYTFQPAGPLTGNDNTIITTGPASPLSTQNKGQKGYAIGDELTFSHLQWLIGDHTVKTGIKYKWIKLTAQDAEDINPQFYYDVSTSGAATIPYKAFFTDPVPGLNPVATSNNQQLGIYLQDDWAATTKLTVNLGVRWDYERTPAYLDHVTPANVVAALLGPNPAMPSETYAQALALGGININDYISNGHNRSAYTGEVAPRLGFSYDLQADQRHVIFGGAGRAYDRDLFDYLQLEETKQALPTFNMFFNVPDHPCVLGPNCVNWDPRFLNGLANLQALVGSTNAGQEVDMVNNNLKVPYSDQFSLGIRNRIGDWNTSIAVARILSYDGFVFTLGNRYPNGAFFQNGGNQFNPQNAVPGFGNLIIGNNGIKTRNTEILLGADKPFTPESHWGATIAYTYSNATQNRDISQHYAFDEPSIADYPFIASNAVPKHRVVMTGSVSAPWGLVVGAKLTIATPIPDNDITCRVVTPPFFATGGSCTPFAVTPPGLGYRSLDMQVTKDFSIRDVAVAYVRLDVLNVFNVKNYSDYILGGNNGVLTNTSVAYNPTGNIFGTPRELRMTLGARF